MPSISHLLSVRRANHSAAEAAYIIDHAIISLRLYRARCSHHKFIIALYVSNKVKLKTYEIPAAKSADSALQQL